MYGNGGQDIFFGASGTDVMHSGGNADTFMFENGVAYEGIDTLNNFSTSQGDKIIISDLLDNYDPLTQAIGDFVKITYVSSQYKLAVDSDGGNNSFVTVANINSSSSLNLQDMISNGSLII